MSPITTHILDTSLGKPAEGIWVTLALRDADGSFRELSRRQTDNDGRVRDLLPDDFKLAKGIYRLQFATAAYVEGLARHTFYPEVLICFDVSQPEQHYHVPLLLNPFGYSTYRGS